VRENLTPSKIVTEKSLTNAIVTLLGIGGSTNGILHILTYAQELGLNIQLELFDELSRRVPCICRIIPVGPYTVVDLHQAGGTPAILKRLTKFVNLDCTTVSTHTIGETIQDLDVPETDVLATVSNPVYSEGGLAVLKGNLAPNGAIVRTSSMSHETLAVQGRARVFDSDKTAAQALYDGKVEKGDVLVLRYQGPKGAPGMVEVMQTTDALVALGLDTAVWLVTDGRFSGFNRGPIIGHISPEAMSGGPIAAVEDGDIIHIDIPNRVLSLEVSANEVEETGILEATSSKGQTRIPNHLRPPR
jgi:dihydroxy-acid dehydratase